MTPTNLLVPTYRNMLQTLAGLLDKAQQQMSARSESMPAARLVADMFPLAAQVRFAAFQAQEAVFKLRGERVLDWLNTVAVYVHAQ